jgi:acyl dehydratase
MRVDPRNRASVPFEELEKGDLLGEYRYTLTPEFVERHRRATDQLPYPDASLAPVSILSADGVNLADQFWDISSSVHAAQKIEVISLPRIGDTLTVAGHVTEKFVRKGRRYVVSATTTTNEAAEVIARGETTGVIVYNEGAEERDTTAPPTIQPEEEVEGPEIGPLIRQMTFEKMVLYEIPGEENIHTSDEIAQQVGLPSAIATGTQFMAYVFDLLQQNYGFESIPGTRLFAKIRLPVFAHDRIEIRAWPVGESDGRRRLRARCTSESGDVIRATAEIPIR